MLQPALSDQQAHDLAGEEGITLGTLDQERGEQLS